MHSQNRVQAIKSRFENLNDEKKTDIPIQKRPNPLPDKTKLFRVQATNNEGNKPVNKITSDPDETDGCQANKSHLYKENRTLTRQSSDPGKKLHRSHAFRCDRNQKISPKRHSSCKENASDAPTLKISDKPRLSRERLKRLNHIIENQMRKENYVANTGSAKEDPVDGFRVVPKSLDKRFPRSKSCDRPKSINANELAVSIPDDQIPQHVLDQYAKVLKPKKRPEVDVKEMTDSGVSSETESPDLDLEKARLKKLELDLDNEPISIQENEKQEEKRISELYSSTETIKRKNPNITLTDTLKKALKQPLPKGPPPQKPPRIFAASSSIPNSPDFSPRPDRKNTEQTKKDPKQMLQKLEKALQKHNESKVILPRSKMYDISETEPIEESSSTSKKEMHYLCTEILDIAHRPLLDSNASITETAPSNCFTSLNCGTATNRSSTSIPYAKLNSDTSRTLQKSCSSENLETRSKFSTFFSKNDKCVQNSFQCHCCRCSDSESARSSMHVASERAADDEHIYDEPFSYDDCAVKSDRSESDYGVLNSVCTENRLDCNQYIENEKIYDVACDPSRSPSPEVAEKRTFESLIKGFENISEKKKITSSTKSKSLDISQPKPPPIKNRSLDIPDSKPNNYKSFETSTFKPATVKRRSVDTDVKRLIISMNLEDPDLEEDAKTICPEVKNKRSNVKSLSPNLKLTFPDYKIAKDNVNNKVRSFSLGNASADLDVANVKRIQGRKSDLPDLLRHHASFDKPDVAVGMSITSKSSENLFEIKSNLEKKFATEGSRRTGKFEKHFGAGTGSTLKKCEIKNQLDVDRENLNKLMSELYDTVSAQCDMETVSRFPVDQDCSSGEDGSSLSRSVTEKRKSYVRRVSSRAGYLEGGGGAGGAGGASAYTTFRSWKSFKRVRNRSNASRNDMETGAAAPEGEDGVDSLDEAAGCLDIERPGGARERALFHLCLLVGINHSTGKAYVKTVFPRHVQVPPHIENLVFPETISQMSQFDLEPSRTQQYSLVITNEKGERSFGYCRRVLAEGASFCLPFAYCLISSFRAAGFYYKVLQEIESRHGTSDQTMDSFLQQLFEKDFPNPGEAISFTPIRTPKKSIDELRNSSIRNSINLGDVMKSKTLEPRRLSRKENDIPEYYDLERKTATLNVESETRVIKRPIEPRLDEDNLSVLLDCVGAPLLIKLFGTLLLERKVILACDNLSLLSMCMEGLQSILYPLVWQQPLVSVIPSELTRDMLEAPLALLAGCLSTDYSQCQFEEGMLIELTAKGARVVREQGDESTIIPPAFHKTLKAALQLESSKNLIGTDKEIEKARNVLISEAFLRFFVELLADFWQHFRYARRTRQPWEDGPVPDEQIVVFDKEQMISSSSNKQTQYFLEWLTETASFNHLIHNMCTCYPLLPSIDWSTASLIDVPYPNYYEVFSERLSRRQLAGAARKPEPGRNVKTALNRKVKLLKNKLRDLVN